MVYDWIVIDSSRTDVIVNRKVKKPSTCIDFGGHVEGHGNSDRNFGCRIHHVEKIFLFDEIITMPQPSANTDHGMKSLLKFGEKRSCPQCKKGS